MGEHIIKMPDVGEGIAEAELVEWHVEVGQIVREDALLAAVMTDKATVEIPSPVDGKIIWLGAEIGEVLSVGAPLIRLEVAGDGNAAAVAAEAAAETETETETEAAGETGADAAPAPEPAPSKPAAAKPAAPKPAQATPAQAKPAAPKPASRAAAPAGPGLAVAMAPGAPRPEHEKPIAAPAVRHPGAPDRVMTTMKQMPASGQHHQSFSPVACIVLKKCRTMAPMSCTSPAMIQFHSVANASGLWLESIRKMTGRVR